MYEALKRELARYEERTPGSKAAHARAVNRLPLGVASNYRAYDPYPLFVKDANGSRLRDLDGNEYVDHNLCFGALMAGHLNPAVVRAVEYRLHRGTMFGMPHDMEWELAEEICSRYPVEMVRFSNSGTECTMHAVRLARAATGRDKIIKMEGAYHGLHDSALVSVKPHTDEAGNSLEPNRVPAGAGVTRATLENTRIASFNDLSSAEQVFRKHPGEIAAVIVEPIMMNVGMLMPEPGYLQGLRELTARHGAMLIFDEVKTGAKLARGGACEFFGVRPDIVCLAKSIGGGFSLAAFGARREVMDLITQHRVFHGGTYNTNPVAMAAGLAMFREVLIPEAYEHVLRLNQRLVDGYKKLSVKNGLEAYTVGAGANGALMLFPKPMRNYRDWLTIDTDLWRQYWFGMVNHGVLAQPHGWDEQWTISVAHTDEDIDRHLEAFEQVCPGLARSQQQPKQSKR